MPETRPAHQEGKAFFVAFLLIVLVSAWFLWRHWAQSNPKTTTDSPTTAMSKTDIRDVRFWNALEVRRRQTANENILFLDTRSDEAYYANHVLDSHRVSLSNLTSFSPEKGVEYVILIDPSVPPESIKTANDTLATKKAQFAFFDGDVTSWQAVGGSVYSWGNPNSPIDQSKVTYIGPDKANDLLQTNSDIAVLDVRDPSDYVAGHLPRAINIPLTNLESRHKDLPLGKEYLVYGLDELTGFQGAVRLFDMHFFGPRVLEGGFKTWKDKNLPIQK